MSFSRNEFKLRPPELQSSNALRNCSSAGVVDLKDDMHSDTCVGRITVEGNVCCMRSAIALMKASSNQPPESSSLKMALVVNFILTGAYVVKHTICVVAEVSDFQVSGLRAHF